MADELEPGLLIMAKVKIHHRKFPQDAPHQSYRPCGLRSGSWSRDPRTSSNAKLFLASIRHPSLRRLRTTVAVTHLPMSKGFTTV